MTSINNKDSSTHYEFITKNGNKVVATARYDAINKQSDVIIDKVIQLQMEHDRLQKHIEYLISELKRILDSTHGVN